MLTLGPSGYSFGHTQKNERGHPVWTSPLLGGGYLLSHFRSTIGVVRLNFSVRNGKRWDPHAMTTLFFYLFSPDGPSCMRRGCVAKKKKPSGERFARKPLCRDFTISRNKTEQVLYISDRALSAARKLSGD